MPKRDGSDGGPIADDPVAVVRRCNAERRSGQLKPGRRAAASDGNDIDAPPD
jgi:hypothetical protein